SQLPGLATGPRSEGQAEDAQRMTQTGPAPLAQLVFLVPDVADVFQPTGAVHQQRRLTAVPGRGVRGKGDSRGPRSRRDRAVAEQEADVGQLPGARGGEAEEQLAGQPRQVVVLDAVGIETGELDIRDVVKTENEPGTIPVTGPPAGGLLDPGVEQAPVGK